jgi:hypothetical protein
VTVCVALSIAEVRVSPEPVPPAVAPVVALKSAASGEGTIASALVPVVPVELLGTDVTASVTVPEPDEVDTGSVEPLVGDPPVGAGSLLVVEEPPELVVEAAASVAEDPSVEPLVAGVGSDGVVAVATGSDDGVGSEGGGALGAGAAVAVTWLVVSVAGAAVSVTGAVAVSVVLATASVAVATGSEAVGVVVADPAIAAVPLRSLIASPSKVTKSVSAVQMRLPGTRSRSNSGKGPLFFRCYLGENREGT